MIELLTRQLGAVCWKQEQKTCLQGELLIEVISLPPTHRVRALHSRDVDESQARTVFDPWWFRVNQSLLRAETYSYSPDGRSVGPLIGGVTTQNLEG